jgi:hypothetical protein
MVRVRWPQALPEEDLCKFVFRDPQTLQLARAGRQLEQREQSLVIAQPIQQRRLQALA